MRYHLLVFLVLQLATTLLAQAQTAPKREFRAAWIATISNIDWPSKPGLPAHSQREEFTAHLDFLQSIGCNTVIAQIRPASDAFYKSAIEPWSRYLTGRQGQPPYPYYDPLTFMVEETHKRNMEFHAWFNPFRGLVQSAKNPNPETHITRQHPEWVIHYGGKGYLNPGEPEVRAYVMKVIMDVVKRYDIDAVHIDDYFYPYRIAGQEFGDAKSYQKHKGSWTNKDDWRRNNVNLFIREMNRQIKEEKHYVKFGISPFGVWRNASQDPRGSQTRGGQTCYDDLYSDVLLWLDKGWIDYCLPQLYWEHGHRAAAFEILLPWWDKNKYNRHMYYGLGVYRMLQATKPPWNSPQEILKQITAIRQQSNQSGYAFYSASNFKKIPKALENELRSKYAKTIALPPVMKWIDSIPPATPVLTKVVGNREGNMLFWKYQYTAGDPVRMGIYRFEKGENIDLNDARKLIAVLLPGKTEYVDVDGFQHPGCRYVITAIDRLWNESKGSAPVSVSQ